MIKNKKINLSEFLFFVSYILYLSVTLLNTTFWAAYFPSDFVKICMLVCSVLLIIKEVICDKIGIKEVLLFLLCVISSSIMMLHINKIVMLPFFIFLYSSRKIDFNKIAKLTIIISTILLFGTIIAAKSGIILNYVVNSVTRKREYLGFLYSLFPQMVISNITALCIYIYKGKGKKKILLYLMLFLINWIIYSFTKSRLSFGLTCILLIIAFFSKNIANNKLKKLLVFSFIVCATVSFFFTVNYKSSNVALRNLNTVLENRLYLGKQSLEIYEINLFGNDVEYIGNGLDVTGKKNRKKYNFVDCMYLNLLEKYGAVIFIIIISLLTYLMYNAYKKKDDLLMYILLIIALHGIIDDLGMYLYYNTFWLIIGRDFINLRRRTINEEI